MKRRQAPRIRAAVPVQTPLDKYVSMAAMVIKRINWVIHEPLQCGELHGLHTLSQSGDLLLDSCLRLFNSHLLAVGFLADSSLFEVQIQADRGLGASNFIPEPRVEFCQIGGDFLVRRACELSLGRICVE